MWISMEPGPRPLSPHHHCLVTMNHRIVT